MSGHPSKSNYISVDTEDLDENDIVLSDINSFVRVYFGDNSDGQYVPNEQETDGYGITAYRKYDAESAKHIIYVENAITGEYTPITMVRKKFDHNIEVERSEDRDDNENNDDFNDNVQVIDAFNDEADVDVDHMQYVTFLRIFFLLCQGILGGFSFITLYIQFSGDENFDIINNYTNFATEYRRFFYLLTSLSLVGALDMLMTLPKETAAASRAAKKMKSGSQSYVGSNRNNIIFIAVVSVVSYSICFALSLYMSITDTLIANKNGYTITTDLTEWIDIALNDSYFRTHYNIWFYVGGVRFIVAVVGFTSACFILWTEFVLLHDKKREIMELNSKYIKSKNRILELSGEMLGELNMVELQSLITTQKLGLERSHDALRAFGDDC